MNSIYNNLVDVAANVISFIVSGGLMVLGVYIGIWYAKNFSESKNFWRNILIIAGVSLAAVLISPTLIIHLFESIKM